MAIKRTFTTKLEPVDAFGLANELLRPCGFTLDQGTPARSQQWRRGAPEGTKTKSVLKSPQVISVEFERGRVNVLATSSVLGRGVVPGQRVMTAYAEAIESVLVAGAAPKAAGARARRVERAVRRHAASQKLSMLVVIAGLIGGAYLAATSMPKDFSARKWLTSAMGGQAEPKSSKKSGAAPVIVVRKSSTQTNAAKPGDSSP